MTTNSTATNPDAPLLGPLTVWNWEQEAQERTHQMINGVLLLCYYGLVLLLLCWLILIRSLWQSGCMSKQQADDCIREAISVSVRHQIQQKNQQEMDGARNDKDIDIEKGLKENIEMGEINKNKIFIA